MLNGNPLEEFFLHTLFNFRFMGHDVAVTQAVISFWVIGGIALLAAMHIRVRASIVPGRFQSLVEMLYETMARVVDENIGAENREKYLPWILSLFLLVFLGNFLGLVPHAFTVTSELVVTGILAVAVYLTSLVIGFARHGMRFLSVLVPEGVPVWMMPLIVPIEIISQLARPLSLAVRLFANMTAGHTILFVLFTLTGTLAVYLKWLPFSISVVLYLLEVLVAFIQAYIFAILSAVYIGQAVKLNH
ncbi:F0F1 ATP synthase subunit A [Leptospirillum ferriphilum]|uniref:ATP synthase subunit a n=1 Tax=Leptospirillum ferriphilum TaxID=178606 RepID=A0A1V3SUQ0_9BACT|nr:F0F1 ATP synthase subunit A [Leptospirillum ferriphilum]OOH71899.1 ATP synthase F0 subunit A [Leptospirillum ferriphilum]